MISSPNSNMLRGALVLSFLCATFVHPATAVEEEKREVGEWRYPLGCIGYGCDYIAKWKYLPDEDSIMFTISTKNRNKWTGIGFSDNKLMSGTDAVLGLVEESGRFFMMDTFLAGYESPKLDQVQNIFNMSAWRQNGITSLQFYRRRDTGDQKDFQFTDTQCPYFVFPVQGGVFNAVNKRIRKHEVIPLVSEEPICIRSAKTATSSTTSTVVSPSDTNPVSPAPKPPVTPMHGRRPGVKVVKVIGRPSRPKDSRPNHRPHVPTLETDNKLNNDVALDKVPSTDKSNSAVPAPVPTNDDGSSTVSNHLDDGDDELLDGGHQSPMPEYTIEIKLPGTWKAEFKHSASEQLAKFRHTVQDEVMAEFQDQIRGLTSVQLMDLANSVEGSESTIAYLRIRLSSKGSSRLPDEDEDVEANAVQTDEETLKQTLNRAINDGLIGSLQVDPSYLVLKSSAKGANKAGDGGSGGDPPSTGFGKFGQWTGLSEEQMKWVVIIGGVSALVLLVVIQALCMIWRDSRNEEKNVVKNEKQPMNSSSSHWKDYAAGAGPTANSAYSYENFAVTEDPDGVARGGHKNGSKGGGGGGGKPKNGGAGNGDHPPSEKNPGAIYNGMERNSFSNHSTAKTGFGNYSQKDSRFYPGQPANNHTGPYGHVGPGGGGHYPAALQPDFYFMPHQRRYSGEIVKLFVDYNKHGGGPAPPAHK